jgi:hypothetical protein
VAGIGAGLVNLDTELPMPEDVARDPAVVAYGCATWTANGSSALGPRETTVTGRGEARRMTRGGGLSPSQIV